MLEDDKHIANRIAILILFPFIILTISLLLLFFMLERGNVCEEEKKTPQVAKNTSTSVLQTEGREQFSFLQITGDSILLPTLLPPLKEFQVLGNIQNQELIDCLIKYESSGNPLAIGDNGKAVNILQFHKTTFDFFKKKYKLDNLIYNDAESQILLADKMISDNLQFHWSTIHLCK